MKSEANSEGSAIVDRKCFSQHRLRIISKGGLSFSISKGDTIVSEMKYTTFGEIRDINRTSPTDYESKRSFDLKAIPCENHSYTGQRKEVELMKIRLKLLLCLLMLLPVFGCTSMKKNSKDILLEISSTADAMYTAGVKEGFFEIGSINLDENKNLSYLIKPKFMNPTWSDDGNILFGLSGKRPEYIYGYPAYWDKQTNKFKACIYNMTLFSNIEGANNPDEPYEVIIQDTWTISRYDIKTCTQMELLVNFKDDQKTNTINGFSYFSPTNEIIYSENRSINDTYSSVYEIVKVDINENNEVVLAQGINPKWSPDGNMIAYIGADGVYVMNADGSDQRLLWNHAFGESWDWTIRSVETGDAIPNWSPDSQWLVFHIKHDELWLLDVENIPMYVISVRDGSVEKMMTGGFDPVWIPKE